ncbi:hypothetical protein BH23THE1_BH23THE1_13170 [soil metagenome]
MYQPFSLLDLQIRCSADPNQIGILSGIGNVKPVVHTKTMMTMSLGKFETSCSNSSFSLSFLIDKTVSYALPTRLFPYIDVKLFN